MSEETLTSLSILTVNWDRGHDLIESFAPIVAHCIPNETERPVALVDLQKRVATEAGIKIPSGALQAILSRCAKEGLVKKKNKVFYPGNKLAKLDYASTQADAARRHRKLLDRLCCFVEERYEIQWSQEKAEEHLLAFLKDGSLPILAAAVEGDPLPGPDHPTRRAKHIISAFVAHLADSDPEGFACLEVVVKGFVLAGVLYYPDLGQVETRFTELEVYCDTPFLLNALGYADEGVHLQAVDLLELLRDLGAKLRCFHHTREEVAGVLEAEAASLRAGNGDGSALGHSMTAAFRREDIEEMIVKIDSTLGQLEIAVVDTPMWTEKPDEVELEEVIGEAIDYQRDRAREKDVQSLAAVARLRELHRAETFEKAKAVFVTTNVTLSRASSRFFRDIEGPGGIPVCLPVETMTRLVWVKKPLRAPDLPKHTIMASSYAALNPSAGLWKKYLTAISRRRKKGSLSDDEYHLLRSSIEARQALMNKTLGEEDAFSAGTLDEVLAHAKAAIRAEAEKETAQEQEQRVAAEGEAERQRNRAEGIDRAHRRVVDERADRFGAAAGVVVATILGIAVSIGALAAIPGMPLLDVKNPPARIATIASLVIVVALAIYAQLHKQITVSGIRQRIGEKAANWWRARAHRRLDDLHRGDPEQSQSQDI